MPVGLKVPAGEKDRLLIELPPQMTAKTLETLDHFLISEKAEFARAVGEFGSLVLITGNLPFKTEVGSVYVFGQIESDNLPGAAAVSIVLLLAALAVLAALSVLSRWRSGHVV